MSVFITRSYTPCAYMLSMYCARGVCLLKSVPLEVDMHLVHNIGYRISLAAARSYKKGYVYTCIHFGSRAQAHLCYAVPRCSCTTQECTLVANLWRVTKPWRKKRANAIGPSGCCRYGWEHRVSHKGKALSWVVRSLRAAE